MAFNARILTVASLKQAQDELAKVNCDKTGIQIMGNKAVFKVMKLEGILTKGANLLKQTFLAKGGEVAVGRGTADLSIERTDVLICATLKQYKMAVSQLKLQPWGLPQIAQAIEDALNENERGPERRYAWGEKVLSIVPQRTLIMGILNVTPDSFSDGGRYNTLDTALRRVEEMIQNGADIIDIGAESTRPYQGREKISAEEEMERLGTLLEKVLAISSVPVSVDTYKPKVALQALQLGAHMINDVWGLQYDPEMPKVIAQYKVPVVIMHNQNGTYYEKDIMSEICSFLQKSIDIGLKAGISFDQFIVDPGIGFGKTPEQNLMVMSRLEELTSLRCPILLGTSNKRFIGEVLQLPVEDRAEGTGATISMGIMKGSNIVRVHEVKVMARIAKMMDAMRRRDV